MHDHVIVLGASIAGLLAAAAVADASSSVTIVERDVLPYTPIDRRGTPQAPHLHSVLSRGWLTIEDLLPGFLSALAVAGSVVLDDPHLGARIHVQNGPFALNRTDPVTDPGSLTMHLATRGFVEHQLRRRVAALPNVTVVDGHDIIELVAGQPGRITGVTLGDRATGVTRSLSGDLVVDATGRASRTPLLLEQLGFGRPPRQSFTVHGAYYSQRLTIPDDDTFAERLVLVVPPTGAGRGGLTIGENGTWTLTVATHAGDTPTAPTTFAEMLAEARRFLPPHVYRALCSARPLTDVLVHRYAGGTWHRYDRHPTHPHGLVVLGDALCCLDPLHGQGITMAALHAHTLRAHVRAAHGFDPQRFHHALAAITSPVWATNQPPGQRPARSRAHVLQGRVLRWAQRKILEAAHDIVVTEQLMRAVNMVDPPQRLLRPAMVARVCAYHLHRTLSTRRSQEAMHA